MMKIVSVCCFYSVFEVLVNLVFILNYAYMAKNVFTQNEDELRTVTFPVMIYYSATILKTVNVVISFYN